MTSNATATKPAIAWGPLLALAAAQFLMVLDQAVMNVSISQLTIDFNTDVTTIQGVITFYSLVMAALMITGGKVGDLVGRRRAFTVGLVIYGAGSGLTAVSWSVPTLLLGWSILEGIGAALVMPALAALIAGNFEGAARRTAFGVIGGMAGVGIAVGPILGGYFTTELSWRYVFVGEVLVVLALLVGVRSVLDVPTEGAPPKLDVIGSVLSAAGLALVVFAVLQSSTWGWVTPRSSPITPFGFSLTIFVLMAGIAVLGAFSFWQRRRERHDQDPLVHLDLLKDPTLRSGLLTFTAQNLMLMGIFFVMPLYIQLVQGLNALDTGIKMLPVSVTMFLAAMIGPRLTTYLPVRSIVRMGVAVLFGSVLLLMGTIQPVLQGGSFALAMALLGVGMGLIASQLGNVVQSSVDATARSEAGGLQYTAQQFGSSLGVALVGSIVISGLVANFSDRVANNPQIAPQVQQQVNTKLTGSVSFVDSSHVETSAESAGLDPATTEALVSDYEDAQLTALKSGLLAVAVLALLTFFVTTSLPTSKTSGPEMSDEVSRRRE